MLGTHPASPCCLLYSPVRVCLCVRYLLSKIVDGTLDPTFMLTHRVDFERLADAYKCFDGRQENSLKLHMQTAYGRSMAKQQPQDTQQAVGAEQKVGTSTGK